jgi:hypothetical protein
MKITPAYLRRAAIWSLFVMVAITVAFAGILAVMTALFWIAGGEGPLFWTLGAAAIFVYLMAAYVAADFAGEIMTRRK